MKNHPYLYPNYLFPYHIISVFFFWSIKTLYLHYFYLYLYSGQRLCLLSSQAAANTWAVPSILAHIWITDQSSHVTYTKISGYIRRWPCYFPLTPSTPCPCHRFERIAYVMWCALLLGNELLRIGCIGSSGWTKTWTRWIPHRSVRRARTEGMDPLRGGSPLHPLKYGVWRGVCVEGTDEHEGSRLLIELTGFSQAATSKCLLKSRFLYAGTGTAYENKTLACYEKPV